MMPNKKLLALLGILILMLQACNIGIKGPPSIVEQAAGTIVAQTMQAAVGGSQAAGTPFASPGAGTQSAGAATLTINDPTNCRSGPGPTFQLITAFTAGTTLQIVGKDTAHNYWLVLIPKTQNTCWASGEYATASGNYQSLPEATPVANQSIPTRPGSFQYNWSCPGGNLTTDMTWTDTSDNENGFNIYRNGVLIVSLPANSTSYTDKVVVPVGSSITYGITAFNQNGESSPRSFSFTCQ